MPFKASNSVSGWMPQSVTLPSRPDGCEWCVGLSSLSETDLDASLGTGANVPDSTSVDSGI